MGDGGAHRARGGSAASKQQSCGRLHVLLELLSRGERSLALGEGGATPGLCERALPHACVLSSLTRVLCDLPLQSFFVFEGYEL